MIEKMCVQETECCGTVHCIGGGGGGGDLFYLSWLCRWFHIELLHRADEFQ